VKTDYTYNYTAFELSVTVDEEAIAMIDVCRIELIEDSTNTVMFFKQFFLTIT